MNNTPEKEHSDPNDFYTKEEAKRYDNNTGMKKSQFLLTKIALDIADIKINKDIKILDIGCGTGFSLEFLFQKGASKKNLYGLDPSKEMLLLAKNKNFKVYESSFLKLKNISEKFDIVISISALQWILTNKPHMQIKNELKTLAKNICSLLKEKGVFVCQYYPPFQEANELLISSFRKNRFFVEEHIYNKESPKKRKYFMVCRK